MSHNRFDPTGKIYKLALDDNGVLVQVNQSGIIKPSSKIINQEGQSSNLVPIHLIKLAHFDMTATRVFRSCPKCKCEISVVIKRGHTTFYVCELCDHYDQV